MNLWHTKWSKLTGSFLGLYALLICLHAVLHLPGVIGDKQCRYDYTPTLEDEHPDLEGKPLLKKVHYLIHEFVVPKTDEQCTWLWRYWRCDPQCLCKFQYKFGDYLPARACRARALGDLDARCDPRAGDDVSLAEKFAVFAIKTLKHLQQIVLEYLPDTDQECKFNLKESLEDRRFACIPDSACRFQYKFGDFHLGRSCRLKMKKEPPFTKKASGGWFDYSSSDDNGRES